VPTTTDDQPDAPPSTRRRALLIALFSISAVVLVLDQASKAWAISSLVEGERHDLVGNLLGFQLVFNPGAALSIATGMTWVLTIVAAVVIVVVFALLRTRCGALVAALAAIGAAAWWSAGGSREAATLLWRKYSPFADAASAPAASASAVEQAIRLEGVLWPALFIGVLLVLVAVLRGITRRRGVRNSEECGEIS